MVALAEVLRQYGPAYLQKYGKTMPATHRQALALLQRCGSGELGYALYRCTHCGTSHRVARSCGNRHCPACQVYKMEQWQQRQMQRLLPCPYFLVTFTVPEELRAVIRSNQKLGYEAMFQSSVGSLRKLLADPDVLGISQLGLLAVLHTWGRTLEYHPHIHMLVPAGGLAYEQVSSEGGRSRKVLRWRASPAQFLAPVKAISVIYRAKMRDAMQKAGLAETIPAAVWESDWVVHSQAVGDGRNCLRYLARYVFRVAISNRRIVSCNDGRVVFLYCKSGSRRWRKMTLDAMEFIRRFLQHVLPSGFLRVRHYGFLHPQGTPTADQTGQLIEEYYSGLVERLPVEPTTPLVRPVVPCPECGQPMELVRAKYASPLPLSDTG